MIAEETFAVTQDNLLTTLPILYKEFEVKLEINVLSFPNSYVSIFHMTLGNDFERIPALWGNGGSNPYFHVCSAINGDNNYCKNFNIPTNTWMEFKLSQKKLTDGSYIFEYVLDNNIIDSVVNNQAADFTDVKVYASDPWYPPFSGSLRNIEICFKGQ